MVSFHQAATTHECQRTLAFLRGIDDFLALYLVSGTGLALQISHRLSTDQDWFSTTNRPTPDDAKTSSAQILLSKLNKTNPYRQELIEWVLILKWELDSWVGSSAHISSRPY